MIAYFAPLTTAFVHALAHKLAYNHDEDCVLFINSPTFEHKNLLFLKDELKNNGIFFDVVAKPIFCSGKFVGKTSIEEVEKILVNHYDAFFNELSYSLNDFSKIYVLNDNHGADFIPYFNIKKIRYTWLQVAKNEIPFIHSKLNNAGCIMLFKKYKSLTPYAENIDVCFRSDSTIPIDFLNRTYTVWDEQKSLKDINNADMQRLYKCFRLDKCDIKYNDSKKSTLVIQNSYGFLKESIIGINWQKSNISAYLGIENYTMTEIFSIMDKVSLDFYAPDTECTYIKAHINEILDPNVVSGVYQDNTLLLPNVYFQILERFLADCGIKFNNVIATASTSIDGMSENIYDNGYVLGFNFSKTWWFYISLYAVLLFAKQNGFTSIYSNASITSQLQNLSDKLEYDIQLIKLDTATAANIKNSVIIADMCDGSVHDFAYEKTDQSNAVAFINDGLSNSFISSAKCELYAPICIKKDKLKEPVCDILFRNETVWIYSGDPEIRKKARSFKFERTMKFLGMRIHTDGITLPDSVELFRARVNSDIAEKTNLRLIESEKKTEYLKMLVQDPGSLITILKKTNSIEEYLDILDAVKYKYVILLAVKDTPGNCLSTNVTDKLKKLGFSDFTKQLWVMYAGMLGKGTVICNKKGDKPEDKVEFIHTDINSGKRFELRSQAWRSGNKAEIVIDQKDHAVNIRGLNFVVYDIDNGIVIDSVGCDWHSPDCNFVRKKL